MFLLKHFQRCRRQEPQTAFFFRVVQYLFIDLCNDGEELIN